MWQSAKDFLRSKAVLTVIGVTVVTGVGVIVWSKLRKSQKQVESDQRYINIEVVPKSTLLTFFQNVREQYSREYFSLRHQSRLKRRALDPHSPGYEQAVLDFSEQSKDILETITSSVLKSMGLSETVVDRSLFYYLKDADIEAAKQLVNEPINNTNLPAGLTVEVAKDILTYFQTHLVAQDEDGLDEYLVTSAQVEDEVWRDFGFESEEVEKAYERYASELQEMTDGLVAQTRFVVQQTSDDSLEEDDPDS